MVARVTRLVAEKFVLSTFPRALTTLSSMCSRAVRALESSPGLIMMMDNVTVTPNFEVRVSSRLRDEFHNGKHYYRCEGRAIWLPKTEAERPNREFLEWHGDSVFRG